jgi:hypothetical protein
MYSMEFTHPIMSGGTQDQTICTQEIPVTFRGEEMYVEPFSLVLQHYATLVRCREKTPPRWRIGKEWICGYPEIRPCNRPGPLPRHRQGELREVAGATRTALGGETIDRGPSGISWRKRQRGRRVASGNVASGCTHQGDQ